MSEYKLIKTRMWQDNWFLSLSPEEKLLWIFLLTNEHSHLSGLFELPSATIEPLSGVKDWAKILTKFIQAGKIKYQDGWIYILNKKKHQPISDKMKDNVNISIKKYLLENKEILAKFESTFEDPSEVPEDPSQTLRQIEVKQQQQLEREMELQTQSEVPSGPPSISSQVNQVLDVVYRKSGGSEVFGSPFARGDATKLIDSFGFDVVLEMAEFAVAEQGKDRYFPSIDTIGDLLSKWPKLVNYREKSQIKPKNNENMERFLRNHPEMTDKIKQ